MILDRQIISTWFRHMGPEPLLVLNLDWLNEIAQVPGLTNNCTDAAL